MASDKNTHRAGNVVVTVSQHIDNSIMLCYYIPVNKKHRKTLEDIFATPVRANIAWQDIETMLTALGAEISEGSGSRVRVKLNGVWAVFHRPHPQKETDRGAVKAVREFLEKAGVGQYG